MVTRPPRDMGGSISATRTDATSARPGSVRTTHAPSSLPTTLRRTCTVTSWHGRTPSCVARRSTSIARLAFTTRSVDHDRSPDPSPDPSLDRSPSRNRDPTAFPTVGRNPCHSPCHTRSPYHNRRAAFPVRTALDRNLERQAGSKNLDQKLDSCSPEPNTPRSIPPRARSSDQIPAALSHHLLASLSPPPYPSKGICFLSTVYENPLLQHPSKRISL